MSGPIDPSCDGSGGVLHDARGEIVRRSQVRRWLICLLDFRDRHRVVMTPDRYTHLFFLDEATALAAGHRPCRECRYVDHQRFRRCWTAALALRVPPRARRRWTTCCVDRRDGPWLVRGGELLRWTPGGYTDRCPLPGGRLAVLTPPTTVATIRAGFRPGLHPTATPRAVN